MKKLFLMLVLLTATSFGRIKGDIVFNNRPCEGWVMAVEKNINKNIVCSTPIETGGGSSHSFYFLDTPGGWNSTYPDVRLTAIVIDTFSGEDTTYYSQNYVVDGSYFILECTDFNFDIDYSNKSVRLRGQVSFNGDTSYTKWEEVIVRVEIKDVDGSDVVLWDYADENGNYEIFVPNYNGEYYIHKISVHGTVLPNDFVPDSTFGLNEESGKFEMIPVEPLESDFINEYVQITSDTSFSYDELNVALNFELNDDFESILHQKESSAQLHINNTFCTDLKLYTVGGRLISIFNNTSIVAEINKLNLSSGTYIFRASNEGFSQKVIIP